MPCFHMRKYSYFTDLRILRINRYSMNCTNNSMNVAKQLAVCIYFNKLALQSVYRLQEHHLLLPPPRNSSHLHTLIGMPILIDILETLRQDATGLLR